jgi:hypothetical protein
MALRRETIRPGSRAGLGHNQRGNPSVSREIRESRPVNPAAGSRSDRLRHQPAGGLFVFCAGKPVLTKTLPDGATVT